MNLNFAILDFLFPRYCVGCDRRLRTDEEAFCLECNMLLPRLNHFSNPEDNPLAREFFGKVKVERAAAMMRYVKDESPSHLVYHAKYWDDPDAGRAMGRMMAQEGMAEGFFDGIDAIVTVPLTVSRRIERGYNQADYIAKGVSQETGIPVIHGVLRRMDFKQSQTALNFYSRRENVRDTFRIINPERVSNKHILLIDDVITTTSTICECLAQLLQAPNTRVSVLSLAKAGKIG